MSEHMLPALSLQLIIICIAVKRAKRNVIQVIYQYQTSQARYHKLHQSNF